MGQHTENPHKLLLTLLSPDSAMPHHRILHEALGGRQALELGLVMVLQKCGSGYGTTLHAP